MTIFFNTLSQWYEENQRVLPWRNTQDAYLIWLSEIILQQTRVEQGWPYYLNFTKTFPDIFSLANASEDQVLKLWQGLGYYSRARNLHHTAKEIVAQYHGIFPNDYKKIMALKGIGDYTAAAILSFAFKAPYPVLDGNVARIISRMFGISTPIDSIKGKKEIYGILNRLIPTDYPDIFNQAMMDFGALQCKPGNPDCSQCPFMKKCKACQKDMVKFFPVKAEKQPVKTRFFYYFVIQYQNKILLQKREGKDIWRGLYEFPLLESIETLSENQIRLSFPFKKDIKLTKFHTLDEQKHLLSHQTLYISFIEPILTEKQLRKIFDHTSDFIVATDIHQYGVPKAIDNFIRKKMG